jgi:hypothetical protein
VAATSSQKDEFLNKLTKILVGLTLLAKLGAATVFTYVAIPTGDNIQTALISTFPTGVFTANNALATLFSIPEAASLWRPAQPREPDKKLYEIYRWHNSIRQVNDA